MKRKVVVQGGAEQILVGLFLPIFFLMDCDPSVNALAGQKKMRSAVRKKNERGKKN